MEKTIGKSITPDPNSKDSNLEMLLLDELKDMHGAEAHQLLILPVMKKAASSLKLKSVLAGHLDCTREHVKNLEEVFEKMGQKTESRKSEVILGITRECETVIASTATGTATRDAALILAIQQLEHFEIAAYGSLAQLARTLELDDIADILETILLEEKEADDLLTSLAENYINLEASREGLS
jgi:ferritin-like metal-binding protein YciE